MTVEFYIPNPGSGCPFGSRPEFVELVAEGSKPGVEVSVGHDNRFRLVYEYGSREAARAAVKRVVERHGFQGVRAEVVR